MWWVLPCFVAARGPGWWFTGTTTSGYIADIPPAECEDTYHAQQRAQELIGTNRNNLQQTQYEQGLGDGAGCRVVS